MRLNSSPPTSLNNFYNLSAAKKNNSTNFNLKFNKLGADTIHFSGQRNALHTAAQANNGEEIKELIETGVTKEELNEQDNANHGYTPFHLAVIHDAALAVLALIKHGGNALNPEIQDAHGWTVANHVKAGSDPQIKRAFEKLGYRLTEG